MVPFPSEFAEIEKSFMKVGEKAVVRSMIPVRLGRDHSDSKTPNVPSSGPLNVHGMTVPRTYR